jgi:hypothetical protein
MITLRIYCFKIKDSILSTIKRMGDLGESLKTKIQIGVALASNSFLKNNFQGTGTAGMG